MVRQRGFEATEMEAMLTVAQNAAERARGLSRRLMQGGSSHQPETAILRLPDLVRECVGFVIGSSNCRVTPELSPQLWPVRADEGHL